MALGKALLFLIGLYSQQCLNNLIGLLEIKPGNQPVCGIIFIGDGAD